jgi:protein ImuB
VLDPPAPARLSDPHGRAVEVSGRGEQSHEPARLECASLPGGGGDVRGWAGPWASDVRWWDPLARRRCARWQVIVDCGPSGDVACIVTVEAGRAGVEAIYD